MNGDDCTEPQLAPDFAARVLDAADSLAARRRRWRVTGASVVCVGIAATAVWFGQRPVPQSAAPGRVPVFASVSSRPGNVRIAAETSRNALSWMFPDAEPLARYADEDTGDNRADTAATLFTDDE